MIVREDDGDIRRAELKVGLMLVMRKPDGFEVTRPLNPKGAILYTLVDASDEERRLLAEHGVTLDEIDFVRWELHQRPSLPPPTKPAQPRRRPRATKRRRA